MKEYENFPIELLLNIGKLVASNDYAVRFYYKKNHPKFHLNKRELLRAVRKGMGSSFGWQKEKAETVIEEYKEMLERRKRWDKVMNQKTEIEEKWSILLKDEYEKNQMTYKKNFFNQCIEKWKESMLGEIEQISHKTGRNKDDLIMAKNYLKRLLEVETVSDIFVLMEEVENESMGYERAQRKKEEMEWGFRIWLSESVKEKTEEKFKELWMKEKNVEKQEIEDVIEDLNTDFYALLEKNVQCETLSKGLAKCTEVLLHELDSRNNSNELKRKIKEDIRCIEGIMGGVE